MAILTDAGRVAIARAIQREMIYLAIGSGSAAWDAEAEPEPIEAMSLVAEIGRRRAAEVGFCEPAPNGAIVTRSNGRFNRVTHPTKHVFFRFAFDFADGGDATVRELGVFMHTEIKSGLPLGQMFFLPSDIQEPGSLLLLERIPATPLRPSQRTTYETVFTF